MKAEKNNLNKKRGAKPSVLNVTINNNINIIAIGEVSPEVIKRSLEYAGKLIDVQIGTILQRNGEAVPVNISLDGVYSEEGGEKKYTYGRKLTKIRKEIYNQEKSIEEVTKKVFLGIIDETVNWKYPTFALDLRLGEKEKVLKKLKAAVVSGRVISGQSKQRMYCEGKDYRIERVGKEVKIKTKENSEIEIVPGEIETLYIGKKSKDSFALTIYDKEKESGEEIGYKNTLRIEFTVKEEKDIEEVKRYRRGEIVIGELVKYFVKRIEEKVEIKAEGRRGKEGNITMRGLKKRKRALFWDQIINLIKSESDKENIGEIDKTSISYLKDHLENEGRKRAYFESPTSQEKSISYEDLIEVKKDK